MFQAIRGIGSLRVSWYKYMIDLCLRTAFADEWLSMFIGKIIGACFLDFRLDSFISLTCLEETIYKRAFAFSYLNWDKAYN